MYEERINSLPHLGFRKVSPCKALAEYIDCYWFINAYCTSDYCYHEFLHPDGGMGLIFNYGNELHFDGKAVKGDSFLDGTNTKTIRLDLKGNIDAIGIRFRPAGAYAFISMPLSELKNESSLCSEINLPILSNLHEGFSKLESDVDKARAIDQSMLKILRSNKLISHLISTSISTIRACNGRLPIQKLTTHLDVNQRKLERLFNIQIGMSPNEFSKTVRMEYARSYLKQEGMTYSDIVYDLGFFDQAHFTKQFKSVVGITPSEYRQRAMNRKHNLSNAVELAVLNA